MPSIDGEDNQQFLGLPSVSLPALLGTSGAKQAKNIKLRRLLNCPAPGCCKFLSIFVESIGFAHRRRNMSAGYRIEAAHARNLAVKRTRMAAMPEVGIFWRHL